MNNSMLETILKHHTCPMAEPCAWTWGIMEDLAKLYEQALTEGYNAGFYEGVKSQQEINEKEYQEQLKACKKGFHGEDKLDKSLILSEDAICTEHGRKGCFHEFEENKKDNREEKECKCNVGYGMPQVHYRNLTCPVHSKPEKGGV